MKNLVSIILPTFNGSQYIKRSIESVLTQSYGNWELIIIDDGSTDRTEAIVFNYVKTNQNIKYFKNDKNLGIQKSLNKGLRESKGEYIARIDDDDDWVDKDKLKKQVEFLEKNKDYILIGTGFVAVDEKGDEIFRRINPRSDKDIKRIFLEKNCFLHSSVFFRKSNVLGIGGYSESEDTIHVEDYDLWLKFGTVGKLYNLPDYSVRLTLRIESLSSSHKILQFKNSLGLIKKYKNNYPGYYKAFASLYIRMLIYFLLHTKFFNWAYPFLYKRYKNI